ncbi:imidazole glycerol phosphate synthase subunit HisF [Risungbinella massiliensis]|uniref:imidazole glycerol phosphate synthase subunit HisF n=1 Tax=Risungbinella massiliensis TaxID=1329796 RepID=UPI0005CBF2C5|nr:imidazole glycerol phosphate synthase subunit HisF [Risungbinella massiliensis]
MLTKRIIPCLDVKEGNVVKGIQFQGLRQMGDPVAMAKRYNAEGADELIFLDISATVEGRSTMLDVVERTAQELFIPLTVGGGISDLTQIQQLLRAGADKVSLNSAAVRRPELIREASDRFGSQCIVVAIDAKKDGDRWVLSTHGGKRLTKIDAVEWAEKAVSLGAGELLVTSMDQDGEKNGYDLPLLRAIGEKVSVPIIASGGCGAPEHIVEVFQETKVSAALAASIFHEETYCIGTVKEACIQKGVPIRET